MPIGRLLETIAVMAALLCLASMARFIRKIRRLDQAARQGALSGSTPPTKAERDLRRVG